MRRSIGGTSIACIVLAAVGSGGGAAATTEPSDELSGTVEFVMLNYDEQVQSWADSVEEGFEALHPDVDVIIVIPAVNQHQQLLTTRARGGTPPDIAAVATAWVPAFVEAGQLVDWSTVLPTELTDRIEPTLYEGARFADGIYGLPYMSTARALFYNTAALEEAGVAAPPETWDDLVAAAAAVEESAAADIGFALQGAGVEAFAAWFPYVYWSNGGEFTDDAGNLVIDVPACVEGLSVLNELVNGVQATQEDVTSFDVPDQQAAFTSGQAAMTISGPWLIPPLEEAGVSYGVAPIPSGTKQATLGVQDAFVLFADAPNPQAATAFIEYLYELPNADTLVEGRGMLPVLTEGFDADRYQQPPLEQFVEMLPSAKFAPLTPEWTRLSDEGTRLMQGMYLGESSPEDVCDQLAASEAFTG